METDRLKDRRQHRKDRRLDHGGELAQAKVSENKQDHHDYTDNVKYVVSTHALSPFPGLRDRFFLSSVTRDLLQHLFTGLLSTGRADSRLYVFLFLGRRNDRGQTQGFYP